MLILYVKEKQLVDSYCLLNIKDLLWEEIKVTGEIKDKATGDLIKEVETGEMDHNKVTGDPIKVVEIGEMAQIKVEVGVMDPTKEEEIGEMDLMDLIIRVGETKDPTKDLIKDGVTIRDQTKAGVITKDLIKVGVTTKEIKEETDGAMDGD